MVTKIFVSQIDNTNADGSTATNGSYIKLVGGAAVWDSSGGITGYNGSIGATGFRGSIGASGFTGSIGAAGILGPQGDTGYQGSVGASGFVGSLGSPGYQGSASFGGFIGSVGFAGSFGAVGYQGSLSPGGFRGSSGFNGSQGEAGFRGSLGDSGFRGSAGAAGGVNFTSINDLSPQSYSGKADWLVAVNPSATGVTFVNKDLYVKYTNPVSNIVFTGYQWTTINYPKLVSYTEQIVTYNSSTNSITLAATNGSIYNITLSPTSGSSVAIRLPTDIAATQGTSHWTVVLYIKQDATGSRTVDWSQNTIKWSTAEGVPGTGPTLSTTANYTDIITFTSRDGGTSWYGFVSARGFAP